MKKATCINEKISVQEMPKIKEDEVDDAKSVTLKADDIGTQRETKIDHTYFPSGPDAKAPVAASPHLPRITFT